MHRASINTFHPHHQLFTRKALILHTLLLSSTLSSSSCIFSRALSIVSPSPLLQHNIKKSSIALGMSSTDTNTNENNGSKPPREKICHFCFLVHGWMGDDSEMSSIHSCLQKSLATAYNKEKNNNGKNDIEEVFIFHKTICNNGKTHDGIQKGGERVAQEVKEYIQEYNEKLSGASSANTTTKSTISFVGNSLGGLYSRYAISVLNKEMTNTFNNNGEHDEESCWDFNVFCTTATPHIGCKEHTFVPSIPRFVEKGISTIIGPTGHDLFRNDEEDIIKSMCTDEERFLKPLQKFKKRVLYANTFLTDFQVPTKTAAFLGGSYPHQLVLSSSSNDDGDVSSRGSTTTPVMKKHPFIVAIFETKKLAEGEEDIIDMKNGDEISQICTSLDSLGWTKVFVDVRQFIPFPSLSLPFTRSSSQEKSFDSLLSSISLKSTKKEQVVQVIKSKDLIPLLCYSDKRSQRNSANVVIPFGHTVMVANSKNRMYKELNKKGLVVMEYLADQMIQDMMNYREKM